jgi:hypothetical protein
MIHTKICSECEYLLEKAVFAMRQHEAQVGEGLSLNAKGLLTKELRKQLAPIAVESFNNAKTAWDAYCDHLIEHGLLTPTGKAIPAV